MLITETCLNNSITKAKLLPDYTDYTDYIIYTDYSLYILDRADTSHNIIVIILKNLQYGNYLSKSIIIYYNNYHGYLINRKLTILLNPVLYMEI